MSTTAETLARLDEIEERYTRLRTELPTFGEIVVRNDVRALVAACRDLVADRKALLVLLRAIGLDEAPSVPGDEGLWLRTAGGGTYRIGPELPAWPAWERARPLLERKP